MAGVEEGKGRPRGTASGVGRWPVLRQVAATAARLTAAARALEGVKMVNVVSFMRVSPG